jgi:hypothetical protein
MMFLRMLPPGLERSSDPPITAIVAGFINLSFIIIRDHVNGE